METRVSKPKSRHGILVPAMSLQSRLQGSKLSLGSHILRSLGFPISSLSTSFQKLPGTREILTDLGLQRILRGSIPVTSGNLDFSSQAANEGCQSEDSRSSLQIGLGRRVALLTISGWETLLLSSLAAGLSQHQPLPRGTVARFSPPVLLACVVSLCFLRTWNKVITQGLSPKVLARNQTQPCRHLGPCT